MTTIHRSPLRMALPLLGVIALLLIWSVYWYVALSFAQSTAARERAKATARGVTLTCASESWGGYPFRFEYACATPHVTLRDKTTIDAKDLTAVAQAYMPWKAVVLLDGPTTVTPRDKDPVTATHQRIIASIDARSPQNPVVIADIRDLKIDTRLEAKAVLLSYRKREPAFQDLAANATGVTLTPPGLPTLSLASFAADGFLDHDTTATLNAATAALGSVNITAKGTGQLDPARRPEGQLQTTISNPAELAKLAGNYLRLTPEQQNGITAALALMGGKATLIAKDGKLSLGPFPIATLKPLY